MKVKVQCACGTRFEFEVEPVNDRMPVAINCPICNADATQLANEVIRQQSAAAPIHIAPAPVVGISAPPVRPPAPPGPPPSPQPAAQSSLRINKPAAASQNAPPPPEAVPAEAGDATIQLCPKHKTEPAVDACVVCGKPLCLKCMEMFGHVCSVFCRQQAEHKRIYVPVYANQKSVITEKSNTRSRNIFYGVTAIVVAFLGVWFWYAWYAREPKIVYRLTIGDKNDTYEQRRAKPVQYYKLVGPNQLLTVNNQQAVLLDVTKNQPLWTTPLPTDSKNEAKSAGKKSILADLDEDFGYGGPEILISSNDLWLSYPNRLVRLDRKTGSVKDNPIHGKIINVTQQENSLITVFVDSDGQKTLGRLNLTDGNVQTVLLPGPTEAQPAVKSVAQTNPNKIITGRGRPSKNAQKMEQVPVHTSAVLAANDKHNAEVDMALQDDPDPADASADDLMSYAFGNGASRFTLAGSSVVQFQDHLLEHKTISHEAMKPKGKSVLDGNVTASQGMELAQEMINDSRRAMTGGVDIEDVSRFQVTLHRWFADNVPDWTGEVTGPPHFYALKTMDLLVAGQTVIAIDRNNKKLWEGKTSYPMHYLSEHSPVLESGDAVYVADPGVLTCFDRATGTARWRLNSVGITAINDDDRGKIYLNTTDAGPDHIKYSLEVNVHEHIHPLIMKVDPASGKVLWRIESYGDQCIRSGKFLYSTWVTQTQSALKLEEGPDTHFNLYLLKQSSGGIIWNFHVDNQHIMQTEVQQNWILLRFTDKLYVLKFWSL